MLLDEQKLTDENAREESGLHAGALHAAGWAFILSDSTAFLLTGSYLQPRVLSQIEVVSDSLSHSLQWREVYRER